MTDDEVKKLAEAVKFQNRKFVSMCIDTDGNVLALADNGKVYCLDDEKQELFLYADVNEDYKNEDEEDPFDLVEFANDTKRGWF